MRRISLIGALGALAALVDPIPAAALPLPWCLKAHMGRSWMVDLCYFRSFEQCNRERFRYGTTSFCTVNPEYYFRYGEPPSQPRRGRPAVLR
jgi:hypothetical protein